jgi:hypothetical protein
MEDHQFARCHLCGHAVGLDTEFYDTTEEGIEAGRIVAGKNEFAHSDCYEAAHQEDTRLSHAPN